MGFMDYLKDIDNNITSIEDSVVVESATTPITKEPVAELKEAKPYFAKDATVELLEYRLKDKLNDVGLEKTVINEVIESVLGDVSTVKEHRQSDIVKQAEMPTTFTPEPLTSPQPVQNASPMVQETIMGRAESILEGVPEATPVGSAPKQESSAPSNNAPVDMNNIADHASALLC